MFGKETVLELAIILKDTLKTTGMVLKLYGLLLQKGYLVDG
jgi:hypothetical protein